MKALLSVLMLCATLANAQPVIESLALFLDDPVTAVGGGQCTYTNELFITKLASHGNTTNFASYATAAFTPTSTNQLLVAIMNLTNGAPVLGVTNTGTQQLTWWQAGSTNYNTLASPVHTLSAWITQLPAGVNPFSMQVVALHTNGSGVNIHVYGISGANTNTPWGTNAIVQTTFNSSNATANPRIAFASPEAGGRNAILFGIGDSVNSTSDNSDPTAVGWLQEGAETAYTTPASGLATYVLANAGGITGLTNTASSRAWAAVALEIRAGTSNCYPLRTWITMTTNYVNTSSTAGGNGTTPAITGANRAYNSLSNALAARGAGLLPTAYRIECIGTNGPDTGVAKQEAWQFTTSETNFIWIVGDNATRGQRNTSYHRIAGTNNNMIYNNFASHVILENLQVEITCTTSAGNNYNCFRLATANNATANIFHEYRDCVAILNVTGGATDDTKGFIDSDPNPGGFNGVCFRVNCVAYGGQTGYEGDDTSWSRTNLFNFNCVGATNEFNWQGGQICRNCISAWPTTGDTFGFLAAGNYGHLNNSSDESSARGFGSLINQTFTFVDVANRDFHLQASDTGAKGKGFTDPSYGRYTNDVDGAAWTSPWSIGFDNP